ncbi:hypothetical protein V7127_03625, partial [Bacillus sp. JJ1773]|uniref:hypothetical protein n=1 Tax=Bacillus sp. JJ1773 TaxID=3122965 RepID=UPI003000C8D3
LSTSRSQACLVSAPRDSRHKPIPSRRQSTPSCRARLMLFVPDQSPTLFDQSSQKGKRQPFREACLVLVGGDHKGKLLRMNIAGTIVL